MQYFRIDYTDHEWYKLMKSFGENLPTEYCDCFDRHGEVAEDYEGVFCCDIYKLKKQERK